MKIPGLFLLSFFTLLTTCNTTDPPVDKAELLLKLEDVSCTEAWITLTTNNIQLPAEINLTRTDAGGNTISHISILSTQDSLLYIDSLLPNQTYKLQAALQPSSQTSKEINFTTMDTTSHNFTFETWTFGTIGSSTLYDCAIISPENIWCVGDIKIADTSINGYTTYNAVHWDGNEWELHRVMFYTFCGQQHQNSYPARAVFAIDDEAIIVASNSQVAYLKNGLQTKTECIPATVNKIWGMSSSDLYVVGNNGNIAHYNGSQWSRIEGISSTYSDLTDIRLTDIYGEEKNVWTSGYSIDYSKSILMKLNNGRFEEVWARDNSTTEPFGDLIPSIWLKGKAQYVASNTGVYYFYSGDISTTRRIFSPPRWIYKIRGAEKNDIIITGDLEMIWHFNGVGWQQLKGNIPVNIPLYSVDIKGNLVAAIGSSYASFPNKAVIYLGRR